MNAIQTTTYNFEGSSLRAMEIDGEPWFVGKDVAEALGYARPNDAIQQHCKGAVKRRPLQTAGGTQEVRVISEPDMLRLIVNSNLPAAEKFERWVFEDVLPSIRKTGSYTMPKTGTPRVSARYREAAAIAQAQLKLCKLMGVEQNMARVITADVVRKESGIDCTPMLAGQIAVEEVPVTPSKLGESMNPVLGGKKINVLLIEAGLQVREDDGSYQLTEAGKEFGVMEPFKSPHSQHVGHRPMWYARALAAIRSQMAKPSNVVSLQGVA